MLSVLTVYLMSLFDVVFNHSSYALTFSIFRAVQDKNLLDDINGKELSFKLNKEGTLASFEGVSGK